MKMAQLILRWWWLLLFLKMPQPTPTMTSNPEPTNPITVIGPQYLATYPYDLTIKSKTLSLTKGSYGVTNVNGTVLFSVEGKAFSPRYRRILLDASGNPLVSLQRKILSTHRRWQVFRGDSTEDRDLLFGARKSSFLQFKTELSVFLANNTREDVPDFKVKGSWLERSCTIYLGDSNTIVAQMDRKHTATTILLDKHCFSVTVHPNVDRAFIVALVVILQEINERTRRDRWISIPCYLSAIEAYYEFSTSVSAV